MRRVEAFAGEYAGGKSEVAINRALQLLSCQGPPVTLVDLDLVEPFATLGPLQAKLERRGLQIIARSREESFGAGEAGVLLTAAVMNGLQRPGNIVLDLGYGIGGDKLLNLVRGAWEEPGLRVYLVVNIARPVTASVEDIVSFARSFGRVDGLVNNSHLGEETEVEFIREGLEIVEAAAARLKVPVVATAALKRFQPVIGDQDWGGHSVWYLERFLAEPTWN